jgi:exopolysaccharide biosynthesis polyprenyl glycosylphosphotransferase
MLPSIKTIKLWQTLALTFVDFGGCFWAIIALYFYRYSWGISQFESTQRMDLAGYVLLGLGFGLVTTLIYGFLGVYAIRANYSKFSLVAKLILGVIIVSSFLISFSFFFEFNRDVFPSGLPFSRFILLGQIITGSIFVLIGRLFSQIVIVCLRQKNFIQSNAVIIGTDTQSEDIDGDDLDSKDNFIDYLKTKMGVTKSYEFEALNHESFQQIQELILTRSINEIYVLEDQSSTLISRIAFLAERYKINFIFSPQGSSKYNFFDLKPIVIDDRLFLEVLHSNLDGWFIILKRLFDIIFASIFVIIFSPIYVIIYLHVKIEDGGNAFYNSERVGPDGKMFKIFKFRRLKMEYCTSESNAKSLEIEQELIKNLDVRGDGVLYKIADDPRSTKIGKFIEKTSLDELPQFFNVILGNLSIVGPRPHQPRDVAKYSSEHYKVLNIKPGITGLAQINGRSDLKFEQEVKYDCYYIENWSFWLDLKIILKTPFALLKRHK